MLAVDVYLISICPILTRSWHVRVTWLEEPFYPWWVDYPTRSENMGRFTVHDHTSIVGYTLRYLQQVSVLLQRKDNFGAPSSLRVATPVGIAVQTQHLKYGHNCVLVGRAPPSLGLSGRPAAMTTFLDLVHGRFRSEHDTAIK